METPLTMVISKDNPLVAITGKVKMNISRNTIWFVVQVIIPLFHICWCLLEEIPTATLLRMKARVNIALLLLKTSSKNHFFTIRRP